MRAAGLGLICGLAFACGGGGGDGGGGGVEAYFDKLRSCELLSDGRVGQSDPLTADDQCVVTCLNTSSCDDLQGFLCTNDDAVTTACFDGCAEDLSCDGGTVKGLRCDGFFDCEDESDEADCPTFSCTDGSEIPVVFKCDGEEDCESGNDEAGCPARPEFTCDDGQKIAASFECDGEADCADSSDEPADCAELICPEPAARVRKEFLLKRAAQKQKQSVLK